jgi:DNA transformation protein
VNRDPNRFDDLFKNFGPIHIRRMFGGEGIYAGETMIGLVFEDRLYLKADDLNRADFLAENCEPFTYSQGRKIVSMSYYEVPDRLLDDAEEFGRWAHKAEAAAVAAKKPHRRLR